MSGEQPDPAFVLYRLLHAAADAIESLTQQREEARRFGEDLAMRGGGGLVAANPPDRLRRNALTQGCHRR